MTAVVPNVQPAPDIVGPVEPPEALADLFIVETPLQLLNAQEARRHFAPATAHLLLLLSPPFPRARFDALADRSLWATVRSVVTRTVSDEQDDLLTDQAMSRSRFIRKLTRQIVRRARLERLIRSYGRLERLFIGNYIKNDMQHFANLGTYGELVVLDDGTDTIRANERRRIAPEPTLPGSMTLGKRLRQAFRSRYVDWNQRQVPALTFFSTYGLSVTARDRLVRHDYRFLRARFVSGRAENVAFFLGQPLAQDGYLTPEAYVTAVQDAARLLDGTPVVYIPHPRESEQSVQRIQSEVGLPIRRFEGPIEIVIAVQGIRPRVLASFFCSALENCAVICGTHLTIKAFRLRQDQLLCCHHDVEAVYAHFETASDRRIAVVSLD